jgi:hypothetical protein
VLSVVGVFGAAGQPRKQDRIIVRIRKMADSRRNCIVAHLLSKDKDHYMLFFDKSQQMDPMELFGFFIIFLRVAQKRATRFLFCATGEREGHNE